MSVAVGSLPLTPSLAEARSLARKYRVPAEVRRAFDEVTERWREVLGTGDRVVEVVSHRLPGSGPGSSPHAARMAGTAHRHGVPGVLPVLAQAVAVGAVPATIGLSPSLATKAAAVSA